MRKIKNLEDALALFENAAIKHGEASREGNYKVANFNYDIMVNVAKYLRECKSLDNLSVFYRHFNLDVRSAAAAYLLPVYEKDSIRVLDEIAKMNVFGSLEAKMTIQEWENGNLRDYYTK